MLAETLKEWKDESGSKTPLLFKYKYGEDQVCMYTSEPGYFIGRGGKLIQKYERILKSRIGSKTTVLLVETNREAL